jgi:hypothetical protein
MKERQYQLLAQTYWRNKARGEPLKLKALRPASAVRSHPHTPVRPPLW